MDCMDFNPASSLQYMRPYLSSSNSSLARFVNRLAHLLIGTINDHDAAACLADLILACRSVELSHDPAGTNS